MFGTWWYWVLFAAITAAGLHQLGKQYVEFCAHEEEYEDSWTGYVLDSWRTAWFVRRAFWIGWRSLLVLAFAAFPPAGAAALLGSLIFQHGMRREHSRRELERRNAELQKELAKIAKREGLGEIGTINT
ncbi:MAG TPA: hypothetical protein VLF91_02730 [Candidatus Saccharimonadales bacterium]|nr:hypothetical protein [Candidatus Saccharimonadales bacterium]